MYHSVNFCPKCMTSQSVFCYTQNCCIDSIKEVTIWVLNELPHDKTNKMACAPSEDSDQPGHPPSLIRVFAVRVKKAWVLYTHWAHSEDSDQSGRMLKLIGVFSGWTVTLLILSCRGSNVNVKGFLIKNKISRSSFFFFFFRSEMIFIFWIKKIRVIVTIKQIIQFEINIPPSGWLVCYIIQMVTQ